MLKYKHRRCMCFLLGMLVIVLAGGCSNRRSSGSGMKETDRTVNTEVQSSNTPKISMDYNLAIKAVIMKIDKEAGVIQLKNSEGGLPYVLTYSKRTSIWDKYGNSRIMEEVKAGDIVEAYIDDTEERLAGLIYNSENWEFQGSENWKFNSEKSELTIGKDKYYYSDDLLILSEGSEASIMDLNKSDILNIQGCGKKVLSVTVERGHGYVKLEGVSDFIGGWVEIGKIIKPVSTDMLLVVPEGNWDVTVVKDGYGGSIGTTVARNEESTVDFTGVAESIVRYGMVEFTIEPEDAKLYIAGREMDYSSQILLEYDTYKIRVSADGYEDYTADLKVEKALTEKRIKLEKEGSTAAPTASPAATAAPTERSTAAITTTPVPVTTDSVSDKYKITINTPEKVNVYFDDSFVGVSPVSFAKISGNHTITLSKAGYVTKSYSVEIGTEERDVSFDLPELEHER